MGEHNSQTCDECSTRLVKVQAVSFEGEWICPSCNPHLDPEGANGV